MLHVASRPPGDLELGFGDFQTLLIEQPKWTTNSSSVYFDDEQRLIIDPATTFAVVNLTASVARADSSPTVLWRIFIVAEDEYRVEQPVLRVEEHRTRVQPTFKATARTHVLFNRAINDAAGLTICPVLLSTPILFVENSFRRKFISSQVDSF